jgi:hypothetical protein
MASVAGGGLRGARVSAIVEIPAGEKPAAQVLKLGKPFGISLPK